MAIWGQKMRILSMSGFVPEQICDTVRFTRYIGEKNISHYCGYVSDFISQVTQDSTIDGAVFPKSCDSTRIIASYIQEKGKFIHQINIPSYGISGAEEYFASEIKRYKKAVEEHYNIEISDVEERTEIINVRNQKLKLIQENLEEFSFVDYLTMIHDMLACPLSEQNVRNDLKASVHGKKIYVIGSFLSNIEFARIIEEAGLTVVGDMLPESGRLVSRPQVALNGDIYLEIARGLLNSKMSPTQNGFKSLIDSCLNDIKKKDAKGVVFATQKYCEPYDYLYSVMKEIFEGQGINTVQITMNGTEDIGKARLGLEAFSDTIEG